MTCRACPNSWNIVMTSVKVIRAGSPSTGLGKLATLYTTGVVPNRRDWPTNSDIQAPPLLLSLFRSEGDQGGFAFDRLGQVSDVVYDRGGPQQAGLADEFGHPGSAVLVVTLEVVTVEDCEMLAVGVEDLEDTHIRLVDRDVVSLFEREPIKLIGSIENTILQHVVEFEVGLYLGIIEIVTSFADLLGVKVPVPRLEFEA